MLYDWRPSKHNLYRRGAGRIMENQNCGWCVDVHETGTHILLHCNFAQSVWREVCVWMSVDMVVPPNLFILFLCFIDGAANKKLRKGLLLIWHSTLWFLWKTQNGLFLIMFRKPRKKFLRRLW
jgi:hypothetical protein